MYSIILIIVNKVLTSCSTNIKQLINKYKPADQQILAISSPQYGYQYSIKGKEVISSPQHGYRYLIKVKTDVIYLFYFIMPVSITCYSIIMDVALVIEAAE